MARRVFISYQHEDRAKAKGFNLLRWNKNVAIEFVGRHLLDPVDSDNPAYIRTKVLEQLKGTSVSVVLIGKATHGSDWVSDEIQWSLDKGNGIVGIKLEPDVPVPEVLNACGAEIVEWDPHRFGDAIERAALAARRVPSIVASASEDMDPCNRET